MIFVERPISAFFLFLCLTLLAAQVYVRLRKPKASCGARRRGGTASRPRDPRSELLVVQGPVASRPSKDERRSRQQELQAKKYFDERATREMAQNRHASKRTVQGSLAHPGRILAMRARSAGFLAERRSAGLSVTPPYDLVGCHAMGLAGIELSDCPVDEASALSSGRRLQTCHGRCRRRPNARRSPVLWNDGGLARSRAGGHERPTTWVTAFGSKTIDFQGCNGCWRTSRRIFTPRGCCSLLWHPSSIAVNALAFTPPTQKVRHESRNERHHTVYAIDWCVSAWNKGSDSLLMQFWERLAL